MELLQDQQSIWLVNNAGEKLEIPARLVIEFRSKYNRSFGALSSAEMQDIWDTVQGWGSVQNQHLLGFGATDPPKHPAKFSAGFIDIFRELLHQHLTTPWTYPEPVVFDPFAGVGTIHQLRPEFMTYGYEIESEWAAVDSRTTCGDSTNLPEAWERTIQAVVTSPTYGNRMADHHEPGKCTTCNGWGYMEIEVTQFGDTEIRKRREPCEKCDGTGKESSQRNTYRHTLGHALNPRNTGQFQYYHDDYKVLHHLVYSQCWRVLEENGLMIVNLSNHIRDGKEVDVCRWHTNLLEGDIGFTLIDTKRVPTQRNGFGANGQLRVESEAIFVYRKVV